METEILEQGYSNIFKQAVYIIVMKKLILDPIGYFLIRLHNEKIEVGFCKYKDMVPGKSNKVLKKFSSKDVNEILRWIEKKKLYSHLNHFEYLKKELNRAKECLDNNKKYVQE